MREISDAQVHRILDATKLNRGIINPKDLQGMRVRDVLKGWKLCRDAVRWLLEFGKDKMASTAWEACNHQDWKQFVIWQMAKKDACSYGFHLSRETNPQMNRIWDAVLAHDPINPFKKDGAA